MKLNLIQMSTLLVTRYEISQRDASFLAEMHSDMGDFQDKDDYEKFLNGLETVGQPIYEVRFVIRGTNLGANNRLNTHNLLNAIAQRFECRTEKSAYPKQDTRITELWVNKLGAGAGVGTSLGNGNTNG